MTTLYDILPKEMLCESTFDDHKYVKKFYNNDNPLDDDFKKNIINAYIVRDLHFNANKTIKEIMEGHCKKLSLCLSEDQINQKRKFEFLESIKLMIRHNNFSDDKISDHYQKFMDREENDKELKNRQKYEKIMMMVEDSEKIEDIYDVFSIEELNYLGW